jgi:YfiH family protein
MMFTPPKPNDGFRWVQHPAGPALVCRPLEQHATHFFTTRGWRLGSTAAPADEAWIELAREIEVDASHLIRVRQVHGAATVVYRGGGGNGRAPDAAGPRAAKEIADIVVSDASDAALAIQTADCLPLLIADRRTGAVAAAHAGWRGLALSVPVVAVEQLSHEFGSRPADLIVAIGPAIGACCYEVGEDVRARLRDAGFDASQLTRWFTRDPTLSPSNPPMPSLPAARRPDHWFFDGWQAARDQLESAGVPPRQVFVAAVCTASHARVSCSYRRDGSGAGRMAAVVKPRRRP